ATGCFVYRTIEDLLAIEEYARTRATTGAVVGFTEAFERGARLTPAEAVRHARTTLAGPADRAARARCAATVPRAPGLAQP
ncbi:hypothetical protein ACWD1W_31140, partial [Streptomyces olivaceoviridis]